jgi:HEAT repeat protein
MTSRTLVGGLTAAGTPEAQSALAAVSRASEVPAETRTGATAGLGLSARPTPEAMKATAKAMDSSNAEQHSAGALALGNQIRESKSALPDAAADALSTLLARLEGAKTTDEIALYLDALGNSGDARALPTLLKYVASDHPTIRAAALGALRFIEDPRVDPLLIAGLSMDSAPHVRIVALHAMSQRRIEPFAQAIFTALRTDASKAVRTQVLAFLIRRGELLSGSSEAIAWAADNDPDPEIRAAAKRAMETNG